MSLRIELGPAEYKMASSRCADRRTNAVFFIVVLLATASIVLFCLPAQNGEMRKSLRKLQTVIFLMLTMLPVSHFLVWRLLVVEPERALEFRWRSSRQRACHLPTEPSDHDPDTPKSQAGKPEFFSVLRLCWTLWKLAVVTVVFFAHFSIVHTVFLIGKTTEISMAPVFVSLCFGIYLAFVGVLLFWEAVSFLLRIILPERSFPRAAAACRGCWPLIRTVGVTLAALCVVLVSLWKASGGPEVKHVKLPVRKLPLSMNNLKLVQLTDVHLGPTVGRSHLQRAVDMVNSLQPDIIAITGDLVDSTVENLDEAALPLKQLKSRYGVYFVTGNHEHYTLDTRNWITYLESLGIVCLQNRNVKITDPASTDNWFYIAGTNDLEASWDREEPCDLDKALRGVDGNYAVILLAHQPSAAKLAVQSQYDISLILSGHTHGGQLFPLILWVYLVNPYFLGTYQPKEGTFVYVSAGAGYLGPPMRVFSRPEINVLTLLAV